MFDGQVSEKICIFSTIYVCQCMATAEGNEFKLEQIISERKIACHYFKDNTKERKDDNNLLVSPIFTVHQEQK